MEVDDNEDNLLDYLPNEMISTIFSFLDLDDLKSIRLTCQLFKMLAGDHFTKLSFIFWDAAKVENFIRESDWMVNSKTKFVSMTFSGVDFYKISIEFCEKIFNRNLCVMEDLIFFECRLDKAWLLKLLERMPRISCLVCDLEYHVENSIYYSKFIAAVINRIEYLDLRNFQYIDHKIISTIMLDVVPKLVHLRLLDFRMNETLEEDWHLESAGFHIFLKLVAKSLKLLAIESHYAPNPILLLNTFNKLGLELEELDLFVDDGVPDFDFKTFFGCQKNLEKLGLFGNGITNERAEFLYKNLIKLQRLEIYANQIISSEGLKCLALFPELKEYTVVGCSNLWNAGVREGIAKEENDRLEALKLYGPLCNDTIVATITNLKQLTKLHLDTVLYFSPGLIPLIYENLSQITDLHVGKKVKRQRRRRAELFEHQLKPPPLQSKDSRISLLKDLEHLSFAGFSKLPGASLEDIAELEQLETLKLKNCLELSVTGFKDIFENCDYIESISIVCCNKFIKTDREKAQFIACYPPGFKFTGL